MGDTIVDESVQRTLAWARAMQEWLTEYERHIEDVLENRSIPKPPRW